MPPIPYWPGTPGINPNAPGPQTGGFDWGGLLGGLGGGMGALGAILGLGQGNQRLSDLQGMLQGGQFSPENWAQQNALNAQQNAYWPSQQEAWQGLQNVGDLGMMLAQQGPKFGTEGAQSVAPAQAMLAQNFQQLSNFNPKEMKQDRGEARQRLSTPQGYTTGGVVGAAAQQDAQAAAQREKMMNPSAQSGAAAGRTKTLEQGQRRINALNQATELENRDIGLSAELGKNINQQQLQGKLGATQAGIGHGQLGVAGVNADTQRGLGAMNAQTGALNAASGAYGSKGGQATTSAMGTKVDVKDQHTALQDELKAALEAEKQKGGLFSNIFGGALSMIPGLDKLGSIPGLSSLLSGAGGLAQFIPGLGTIGGAALSGLGSYLGNRR